MKKLIMMLFAAALTVSFAACDGGKKQAPITAEEVVVTVEDVVEEPEAPKKTPAEMLKEFQDYVKEYGEASNNKAKKASTYAKLARRSQQMVADMEAIKSELNAKQLKDYEAAKATVVKINSGGK